jgi:hypothetical protein
MTHADIGINVIACGAGLIYLSRWIWTELVKYRRGYD